ncbi:probable dual specificity protein phosphatase DDB_G0281963 [Tachysurus vachellii]|uniref:probable dual specificity protein phosphatase DDB_G0281963 n=1 Tax=Tachysurus vachellii TaxID=175792 RepID=UPI00296B05EF|nr:probable dual specificity protein phosphatase DDB_G0281963 [Tachysurus vachellii]
MVFQSEQAPLSRILPQLYLGAESDVTQDCLSARGISYVLSVSRCCPQPSFLPQSQYLRIPIDDSLRDDLLPWIPQALRFIDGAMSLGCSVIVHCAAGISRSPALAVAYIMYSLEMDLDHAYRFVKERRPTISPNFNFLGQLQLFQHTLPLKNSDTHSHTLQPVTSPDMCTQTTDRSFSTILLTQDGYDVIKGLGTDTKEDIQRSSTVIQSGFTLALSNNLRTLTLSAEHVELQTQTNPEPESHTHTPTPQKPTHLHIQSLSEKRKSLTLSLTPLGLAAATHTDQQRETAFTDSCQNEPCSSSTVLKGEAGDLEKEPNHLMSNGTSARCSRTQKRRNQEKNSFLLKEGQEKVKSGPQRRERGRRTVQSHTRNMCVSTHQQQEVTGRELSGCALEAVEVMDGGPVSPIHLTINRLLGWGERLLLGVLLGPHVKVGHAALPYRC